MAWHLTSTGFLMKLSAYIPLLIEQDFKKFFNESLLHGALNIHQIGHWAIHPGGRKILEVVGQSLNLKNQDLAHSYQVLKDYGNMSSPTILFVLKSILDANQFDQEKPFTFGAAFGPGLTIEAVTLMHV
jgi:predicted naringenin-chalcone synthase